MKIKKTSNLIKLFTLVLFIAGFAISTGCSSNQASTPDNYTKPVGASDINQSISNPPIVSGGDSNISQPLSTPPAANTPAVDQSSVSQNSTAALSPTIKPTPNSKYTVTVVVAGYINHGPLQPTVTAIKEVLAKYSENVKVQWIDLATTAGAAYFKANNLSAHMNVIMNGKYTYQVSGKDVTFQWFEGQGWTKQDLDTVLSNLINK
jgi:hypothetical protein